MMRAKDNPFAVDRWAGLGYIPKGESLEQLLERLAQLNYTAALVGPHGTGKTTLLEHAESQLRQKGIKTAKLFINLETPLPWSEVKAAIGSMPPGGVLFFDGACHLPRWRFGQLKRAARKQNIGLVITAHHEGLLPTWVQFHANPALLKTIVGRLLDHDNIYSDTYLSELLNHHRGNLRDCLWHLYDDCAANGIPCTKKAVHG